MKAKQPTSASQARPQKAAPPPGDVTGGNYQVAWADAGYTALAGNYGVAASALAGGSGKKRAAKALYYGVAVAGSGSNAEAANRGVARVGDGGTALAGTYGVASCHKDGDVRVAQSGVAICFEGGKAKAGDGGVIVLGYHDPVAKRTILKVGRVEPDGPLKKGVFYRLDRAGDFVEVR